VFSGNAVDNQQRRSVMNTFKKIVAAPLSGLGWMAGQFANGYAAATKASEPVVAKATKAAKAVKAKAAKAKDATVKAAARAKAHVVATTATVRTKVTAATTRVTAFCDKARRNVWAALTGHKAAVAALFLSLFAGIEYIFAYCYFLVALVGLVFGMSPALATMYATAGMLVFAVGLAADLVSIWLQSVNTSETEFEIRPDFFGGRRLLALN
jgi:hypothetical protein